LVGFSSIGCANEICENRHQLESGDSLQAYATIAWGKIVYERVGVSVSSQENRSKAAERKKSAKWEVEAIVRPRSSENPS